MKTTIKTKTTLNLIYLPHPLKRILPEIFLMTSHLNSHRTTDIKPEMLSGVKTGNGTPPHRLERSRCVASEDGRGGREEPEMREGDCLEHQMKVKEEESRRR